MAGRGRPKGPSQDKPWTEMLRLVVMEKTDDDGKPTQKLRRLAEKCVSAGLNGDMTAVREIADRLDGKPLATVSATINYPLLEQDIDDPA